MAASTNLNNSGTAVDHLAVVKGDVDDLGYIFSEGLENKLSLSRYMSLSRMMNAFFTVSLPKLLAEKYPDIYTVYAGGDDFVLVGPWEEALEASMGIRQAFYRFTGENESITLSVGISIFSGVSSWVLLKKQK